MHLNEVDIFDGVAYSRELQPPLPAAKDEWYLHLRIHCRQLIESQSVIRAESTSKAGEVYLQVAV